MKSRQRTFLGRIGYSLTANTMSSVVSFATAFLLPKYFGDSISQYGYWQVFMFYLSYLGFFHFGWCDGIYLFEGGKYYQTLDYRSYAAQLRLITLIETCIALAIIGASYFLVDDKDLRYITNMLAANLILVIPRTMLLIILQSTNRIKEYSLIIAVNRFLYIIGLMMVFVYSLRTYKAVLVVELAASFFSLLLSLYFTKEILMAKPAKFAVGLREAWRHTRVGISLLASNISSLLITGVVRWGIQYRWQVSTYGKVALSLSISNLLLTFIVSVSTVLYPTLRRIDKALLVRLYPNVRSVLVFPLLGILIIVYPLQLIIGAWLPAYSDSLVFLAVVFPLAVFSSKTVLLVQTYMNVFRYERTMLKVNGVSVLFSAMLTYVAVFALGDLMLTMFVILFSEVIRSTLAECMLAKRLKLKVRIGMIVEFSLVMAYYLSHFLIGGWIGVLVYTALYSICLLSGWKQLKDSAKSIKQLL